MSPAPGTAEPKARGRDARIDLARGLTMLIIFVAHVPGNLWAEFIPARMGFSSGAEAFVLCSGLACGIAFGGTFQRDGWLAGTRRIGKRVWQLWLAQVLTFGGFAALMLSIDAWLGGDAYAARYSLAYPVGAPLEAALALMTLRYVPDFFDILPLYIVLLAAVPLMSLVAGASRWLVLGLSAGLWLVVQVVPLNLPANPAGTKLWYFDPLAWQFLFFLGYATTAGWLTPPRATPARIAVAGAIILACIPLTFWGAHAAFPVLGELYRAIYPAEAISTLHPLRLAHVLLLAWLFAALLASRRSSLYDGPLKPVLVVGQQSLTTFLTGIVLAALAGVALDLIGRGIAATALINLTGCALLVATAYAARTVKASLKTRTPTGKDRPWLATQ
ncbi:OpgC domain-containing protein [Phreatobacter sp.]|uniref:OpgC family protein n=1 Tax=Phreatobacter sp. TaxID=1966341 RepID=UPI0022CA6E4A|nr:OpgC domain-containing protein [Phreatobacter sp.]MCZ8313769.1 OpgC domain-containing protein [Phreatobacter sp.]